MKTKLHLHAPKNWINDPNGFIYYKGNYHLFYQYFPYDCIWGTMHWNHATSKDLSHWQQHGIALFPTKEYDQNGCFSGSAIEIDDQMYIYYTGVTYYEKDPENVHITPTGHEFYAAQAMIISKDGFHFDNYDKKEIIPILDGKIGHATHTRDPKVWKYNDQYYMIISSKYFDEDNRSQGQFLFYVSKDGKNWTYQNNYRGIKIGDMWECPDTFSTNDQQLVIFSPERTHNDTLYPSHARIATCTFDHENCEMEITGELGMLDYGLDIYAPQTTLDENNNRIVVGWMRMPKKSSEDWIGLMTYPRIITYKNNHIYTNIHPFIDDLFTKETDSFKADAPCKITLSLQPGDTFNLGGYQYHFDSCLHVDRKEVFVECENGYQYDSPNIDHCNLSIYVDDYIIETYINDGEYVISHIVYDLKDEIQSKSDYKIYIEESDSKQ